MANFIGTVQVAGRSVRVEVERGLGRTRAKVDGRVVLDERPMFPPSTFALRLPGASSPVSLVFEAAGWEEACAVVSQGKAVPLARVSARTGAAETTEGRWSRHMRWGGLFFLGMGAFLFARGWPTDGRYRPASLATAPWALLVGLLFLAAPSAAERLFQRWRRLPRVRRWIAGAVLLAIFLVSGRIFVTLLLAGVQ
jgi:hypothetical protein